MIWCNEVAEVSNHQWGQDASYMNGDRRSWINTSPILRLGTVEFRLFDGTLDPEQIRETALFLMHLVDGAIKGRNCRWGKADAESREILLRSMLSAMGFYTTTPEEDGERAKICRKWATKMARDHGWIAQEQRRGRRTQPRNPEVTVVRDDARDPDRVTHVYIRRPGTQTAPDPDPYPVADEEPGDDEEPVYVPSVWTGTSTNTPIFVTSATNTSTTYEITSDWTTSWDSNPVPTRVQEQMNAAVMNAAREAAGMFERAASRRALHGVLTPQVPDRLMHALLHDA